MDPSLLINIERALPSQYIQVSQTKIYSEHLINATRRKYRLHVTHTHTKKHGIILIQNNSPFLKDYINYF